MSRRGFLGALGAAGAMAPGVCMMGASSPRTRKLQRPRFAKIASDASSDLPPFATPSPQLTAALTELGKPGGIMDAKDPLEVGPILLITDPALSLNNPDNTTHTAGTTFFGQFVDHDVTFDLGSTLGEPTRPEDSTNTRSPALDLDSVYGGGPVRSPQLYGRRSSREPLGGNQAASSSTADCSKICRALRTARRSSAIRATTSTSSSPACMRRS